MHKVCLERGAQEWMNEWSWMNELMDELISELKLRLNEGFLNEERYCGRNEL